MDLDDAVSVKVARSLQVKLFPRPTAGGHYFASLYESLTLGLMCIHQSENWTENHAKENGEEGRKFGLAGTM